MTKAFLLFTLTILVIGAAFAQDCKPETTEAMKNLKDSVRRVAKLHEWSGSDDKAFNRAGDMAALAILQTIPDDEMISPDILREVFWILRDAFACPSLCVEEASDRQPVVTMLLLEHLHNATTGSQQAEVDETRNEIFERTRTQK